ncbi:ABC transporter permease [bacterium]|nr:ABC transporter permease [bacterium]
MKSKSSSLTREIIIKPKTGWQIINWKELKEYKDLIYFLVLRDVTSLYKQTVLGFSWAILRPFIKMVIFSVVFGGLAKIPSDGIPYPLFVYAGLVPWEYFSTSLTKSTGSLITGVGIYTKVYFPRLILPIVPCIAILVDFAIALSIVFILMLKYGFAISFTILYLPILILLMILFTAGLGIWLSALAIQYRDVTHGVQFLVQILMYAAPVIYPISWLPESYRIYLAIYPMYGVIEGFRAALLGQNAMPWDIIGMGAISAFVMLISGAYYFKRKERIFADVA